MKVITVERDNDHDIQFTGEQVAQEPRYPRSPNTYAVAVSGESMADVYPEGYIIFVDPNIHPEHGDDVIVRVKPSNEVTFKRYLVDGSQPYLKAMNKDWPNPIIPIDGDAEFCGVVIFAGINPQRNKRR